VIKLLQCVATFKGLAGVAKDHYQYAIHVFPSLKIDNLHLPVGGATRERPMHLAFQISRQVLAREQLPRNRGFSFEVTRLATVG
jgi:hypothetical protein